MAVEVRERKSRFIHLNDTGKPGIVCGPFYALSYYIGCPYKCSYCYLQGTFRGRVSPVVYSNREKLLKELEGWLTQPGQLRLNAGELEDSLALDGHIPLVDDLVPRFAAQRRHKLLLVSKSTNIRNLLKHDPEGQVIVGFSVNAPEVWERFEEGTPHPLRRAEAAARVKEAGYYLTLRLDPMIPIDGWEEAYGRFIDAACAVVEPHQWTIGSLRYFPTLPHWTRRVGRDDAIFAFGKERCVEDGRKRVDMQTRARMYRLAFERIRACQPKAIIRLCKETEELYETVGLESNGCCYSVAVNGKGTDPQTH